MSEVKWRGSTRPLLFRCTEGLHRLSEAWGQVTIVTPVATPLIILEKKKMVKRVVLANINDQCRNPPLCW